MAKKRPPVSRRKRWDHNKGEVLAANAREYQAMMKLAGAHNLGSQVLHNGHIAVVTMSSLSPSFALDAVKKYIDSSFS